MSIEVTTEDKSVVVGLISQDGVLRQGALSPCVCAAYAMDGGIDIDIDKAPSRDVTGMTGTLQVLLTIVPGADAERIKAVDNDCMLVRGYLERTDITTVAVVLRMDVFRLILAQRHLIDTQ